MNKYIKAHCSKCDKWFSLEIDEQERIVNFVNLTKERAKEIATEVEGTSFKVSPALRRCSRCGSMYAGKCSHSESLGLCGETYSYQCLFCHKLKISYEKATCRFTEWAGANIIPDADTDRFGNARGSNYDLAKDGSFEGFNVVILCLYTGEGIIRGIKDGPKRAVESKGFKVTMITSPDNLASILADACQLWVISDRTRHLNEDHLSTIRNFYEQGHGLYIFGDNDPFYADANYISNSLWGVTMSGNEPGDKVIGFQTSSMSPGIRKGHLISTGISNIYEGVTIATVTTSGKVKPLMYSSHRHVVTAIVEDKKHRSLIDGGFTRLFYKWNTAGTARLIVNCAAWLANADNVAGGEVNFT